MKEAFGVTAVGHHVKSDGPSTCGFTPTTEKKEQGEEIASIGDSLSIHSDFIAVPTEGVNVLLNPLERKTFCMRLFSV